MRKDKGKIRMFYEVIEGKEVSVILAENKIYLSEQINKNVYERTVIEIRAGVIIPSFSTRKRFQNCIKVELKEIPGAGFKAIITDEEGVVHSEGYLLKRKENISAYLMINDKKQVLKSGVL